MMTGVTDKALGADEERTEDTLFGLLTYLERSDQELIAFDVDLHKEALERAQLKVDNWKYILNRYESRISEIQREIDELVAVKKLLQQNESAAKRFLLWVLKAKSVDKFKGKRWLLNLRQRKKITAMKEPDTDAMLNFPELVKIGYSWDKKAFDEAFKKNPESLAAYGKEDITEYIDFRLVKGIEE